MRIRYTVPFKQSVIIDDHWTIPIQGGKLRVIEEDGYAKALELTFAKQPLEYAPHFQMHAEGKVVATITGRDHRLISVNRQLDDAATFLECIHDINLITDEIEIQY